MMGDPLDQLPVRDGFRMRGLGMTRIETFTDAAFAFAVTTLVVSTDTLASFTDLSLAMRQVPALVFAFAMIMMFWYGHHTFSQRYGLDDFRTIVLSGLLVFVVLVYVFPLRFLAGVFVGWITTLVTNAPPPAGTPSIAATQLNDLFVLYGVGFCALSGTLVLLNHHALRQAETLGLNALELITTRATRNQWAISVAVGGISIVIALAEIGSRIGLAGWAYCLLWVFMPWYGSHVRRAKRALEESTHDSSGQAQ